MRIFGNIVAEKEREKEKAAPVQAPSRPAEERAAGPNG